MKSKFFRLLSLVTLFTGVFIAVGAPVRADDWGAWKFNGSSGTGDCLVGGTLIQTGYTPDKHSNAASNTCETGNAVAASEWEFNSSGQILYDCNPSGNTSTNYSECHLKVSTGTGDYWKWIDGLVSSGIEYFISCSNQGAAYAACYNTDYP